MYRVATTSLQVLGDASFHRDAFREVSRLVNVVASADGYVVGEEFGVDRLPVDAGKSLDCGAKAYTVPTASVAPVPAALASGLTACVLR